MQKLPNVVGFLTKIWLFGGLVFFGMTAIFIILTPIAKRNIFLIDGGLICFGLIGIGALILAFGLWHHEEWAYDFTDLMLTFRPTLQDKFHAPEVREAFGKLPEDH